MRNLIALLFVLSAVCALCPIPSRAQAAPDPHSQPRALEVERSALQAKLNIYKALYGPDYPGVLNLRRQIKVLDTRLKRLKPSPQPPLNSQEIIRRSRVSLLSGPG